jgi:hypothetical protein
MDLNSNNNNKKTENIPKVYLDKYINENVDIKKSPFLYLMQIATDEGKLKQRNINNKINNLSGSNFSLYSNQEANSMISQDIDIYLREIIDKNDTKFLSGESNLFDFLIAKYLNIDKEKIPEQENITFQIDLQMDDYNFLNEFGLKMPKLIKLNLENSILKTISNIGTSFKNLQYLNINNCQIEELEGKFIIKIEFNLILK